LLFSAGLLNAWLFAASIQPLSTPYSVCKDLGFESSVNKRFRMIKEVNNRDLMHEWTNPRVYNWVAWAAVVILVALTSVLVGITVRDIYFASP
jgi:Mn2+/Fe2+ NRAMP family transporter